MPESKTPFNLAGKVALLTGAGRGIGRSTAIAMAHSGADIAVVSRSQAEIDEVVETIVRTGGRAFAIRSDLTDRGGPDKVIESCIEKYGRLDVLVNNAGCVIRKRAEDTLPEDWDTVFTLNVKAMAEVCRLAIPHLKKNPGASIVNMSSITGMIGTPMRAAYASTKAAILGYTRVLAKEVAPYRIRANAVAPGFIDTAFVTPYLVLKPELMKDVLGHIPLGRIGTSDEVAWPIVFLSSPAAEYITGQTIIIDGGWMLF
jgi:NAD(P)-dependent dehydrogenase (short-subunit alcohol dehydrogenase family)